MRYKFSFEGKEINPGDVVVIRPQKLDSAWFVKEIFESAKKSFPDHHVVFLPPDYFLETYDKEQFKKFLKAQEKYISGENK